MLVHIFAIEIQHVIEGMRTEWVRSTGADATLSAVLRCRVAL